MLQYAVDVRLNEALSMLWHQECACMCAGYKNNSSWHAPARGIPKFLDTLKCTCVALQDTLDIEAKIQNGCHTEPQCPNAAYVCAQACPGMVYSQVWQPFLGERVQGGKDLGRVLTTS
eukprot:1138365-Pelagomonas_calceolata.AAC.6